MADSIVQAKESFSADVEGAPVMIRAGDLYYFTDPIVRGREHLFGDVTVLSTDGLVRRHKSTVTGTAATETASAEPGTRRRMSRQKPIEPTGAETHVVSAPTETSEV